MANHWTPNSTPYEDNMTLTGFVRIDNTEQQTTAIEVGAFCGEECRGSGRLAFFNPTYRYVVQMVIYGNIGDQITFRLYDHETGEELDLITYDTLTFMGNGYGSLAEPYMLNFYSEPPGPHAVTVWADPEVGGIVTGGGSYDHGATATLTATANEDYVFAYWAKDGQIVSENETFEVVVIEPGDYVAHFDLSITPHWTPTASLYEDNMTLTGVIHINGVEQQNPLLEVGVFCGEECRGSATPTLFEPTYRFVVQLLIYGESGEQLTFRLYDHEQNTELDLYPSHTVTFSPYGYGTLADPYILDFNEAVTEVHTITATVNLEGSGTVEGTGSYLHGTTCSLGALPNGNYAFDNWTENGALVSTANPYAFEVTESRSLVANFVPVEGNHWTPNTAPYEDNMTLTGIVKINFVEQQTSAIEVGVFCGEECRGTGRLAFFQPTQHYVIQLVVYGNDGDELTFKLFDHRQNAELDLVAPEAITLTENGYGSLANPYVLSFLESFEISTTANPAEGGTVTGAGNYPYGTTATLTATANTGYHFVNWTLVGEVVSNSPTYSFEVTDAGDYVANFELNNYDITATANPEAGGTVEGSGTYNHFSTCTLTATSNTGYHFLNWTHVGEVVSNSPTYSFEVTDAGDYVANFELNSYDITATANPEAGGTVEGAGTYNHFSTCTLTATPNTGYHFVNWILVGEVVSNSPTYSFTVTEAADYVANFELNSYEITATANPEAGGAVEGAGEYNHFSTCTLTATPNTGYHFLNWTHVGEIVSNSPTYSFEVTGDADYIAHFELNTYDITATANPTAGGTVEGAGTYNHFSTCTLTATPNTGYHFLNWTHVGEVVSNSPTYTFEVTGVADYVANFELNTYAITATANPETGGAVEGAGEYNHFDTCTLTATANEDYYFVNWTLGGEVVSDSTTFSFEVTGAADYVANFELTTITQTTNLTTGWNWWSTYIESDDLFGQLKTGLEANASQIKSSTSFVNYFNGMWIGGLNNISNESCYLIKANNACTLEMTGNQATPANHPITINPNWNWIGYPNTGAQSVANAFSNITPANGDQVKSMNAFATYYNGMWVGGLNTITPGMGLLYKSTDTEARTLIYPEPNRSEEVVENVTNEDNHWTADYHAYPSNMTVMAVIELDDAELQGENYELAAFANGECRGSARLMYVAPIQRYVAFLIIVGDEASELRFSLHNDETGTVKTQDITSLQYETNAIVGSLDNPFVVRFRSTTGVDEWVNSVNIFPNPVNRGEQFSLGMTTVETLRTTSVQIVNALGVVVETLRATSVPAHITAPKVAGVYTLRITVEGKGTCYRKLVVR